MIRPFLTAAALAALALPAQAQNLLIRGGTIHTGNDAAPTAEVVIARDGRIAYVGSAADAPSTEGLTVIDLDGATLFPGFTDGHAHLDGVGWRELTLNLEGSSSVVDAMAKLTSWADTHPDGPIIGRGWIETRWPESANGARFLTAADLDAAAPGRIVLLERADGHAVTASSAALAAAHIDASTAAPSGGEIAKDANGRPTGFIVDAAVALLAPLMPQADAAALRNAYRAGFRVEADYGWTGVHFMSAPWSDIPLLEQMAEAGEAPLARLQLRHPRRRRRPDRLGSPQRRRRPDHHPRHQILCRRRPRLARRRAARPLLRRPPHLGPDADERRGDDPALRKRAPRRHPGRHPRHRRPRQHRGPQLVPRRHGRRARERTRRRRTPLAHRARPDPAPRATSRCSATCTSSPRCSPATPSATSTSPRPVSATRVWTAPTPGIACVDLGVIVVGGSDAPVERGDPLIEFYAAVARRDLEGFQGPDWRPNEAVDRATALKMFTLWPAYASFRENELGTIEVGKRADFTAFDIDLMTVPFADIPKGHAVLTVVDGEVVYRAD